MAERLVRDQEAGGSIPPTPTVRWLRGALTLLVASLFALSFWENWAALTHAAVQGGIPHPGPWPWMVDGFILAMALMAVQASMERRNAWWPRAGMVGSTALSLAVVVSHAPHAHGGPWLAAWSPVAVLFSFECLMWLVFGARATVPDWLREADDEPQPSLDPESEPERAPTVPPAVPATQTVARSLTPADREALRRVRHDPARLAQIAARRGLDRGAVDATVAAWASRNGHHTAGVP